MSRATAVIAFACVFGGSYVAYASVRWLVSPSVVSAVPLSHDEQQRIVRQAGSVVSPLMARLAQVCSSLQESLMALMRREDGAGAAPARNKPGVDEGARSASISEFLACTRQASPELLQYCALHFASLNPRGLPVSASAEATVLRICEAYVAAIQSIGSVESQVYAAEFAVARDLGLCVSVDMEGFWQDAMHTTLRAKLGGSEPVVPRRYFSPDVDLTFLTGTSLFGARSSDLPSRDAFLAARGTCQRLLMAVLADVMSREGLMSLEDEAALQLQVELHFDEGG